MQLDVPMHSPVATNNSGEARSTRLFDRASTPLFLAYAGAGLGYVLPMTFLPLLANVELQPGHWLQDGSWQGLILCAILVGVTFLGTVLLTQRIGRALHPHQGPRLSAAMVALYGFTQMAGPWLTKQWLDAGGTLASAFGIGVGMLAFGLEFLFFVPRPNEWHSRAV